LNGLPCAVRKEADMKSAIAYYRVSTERQGRSGLGLEAQQKSVQDFARSNGFKLVNDFIEMESGKRNGRTGLVAALKECKRLNATLLIAKLDRLSRSVAFIAALMEASVDFKVVDNPFAEKFTLHILAAVAQKEREDISQRTIAALAAAKRRGVKLGKFGSNVLSKRNRIRAKKFAQKMRPLIVMLEKRGVITIRAITDELNRLNIPTFRNSGQKWHLYTVHTLIKRLNKN
jgi:DNA invertase Pin-like site-specific DNA recombinase